MKQRMMTQTQYARHRKVSPPYIHKLVKLGVIRLYAGKIDPVEADMNIERNSARPPDGESYSQARSRRESANASLREIELKIRQGRVIERDKAVFEQVERELQFRRTMLSIPKAAPGRLLGKGIVEMQGILTELIYNGLRHLATGPCPDRYEHCCHEKSKKVVQEKA